MVGALGDAIMGLYLYRFWKILNPKFLSLGFWYLILFNISDLEFGILQLNNYTGILRLGIGSCMLVYGSYSDARTREVSDVVWLVMAVSGVFLASVELFMGSLSPFQVFISLIVGVIFAFLLYLLNFGGADIKAIISLSLLFPNFPFFYAFHLRLPVTGVPPPPLDIFVLSMLTNCLLIALLSPISLFLSNSLRKNFSSLMFLGWKVEISELRRKKNFKLMHEMEDKSEKKRYIWGGIEPTEEILSRLEELERRKKIKEVWITPELPFIVYLTAGFFTAAFYGDFISILLF